MQNARFRVFFLPLLFAVAAIPALAGADDTFSLSASAEDFDSYFPSYLANGYFSTMTAPRGTEGNLAYMVAFMDYGKDDESRPAAIPGWSEIDYSTGDSAAGHFWMNQVPLNPAWFKDYRQTLNMKEATLTTSYRYVDHKRSTQIKVTTFVSQAVNASGRDPDFADAGLRRHRGAVVCLESVGAASAAPAARQADRRANARSGRREQYAARGDSAGDSRPRRRLVSRRHACARGRRRCQEFDPVARRPRRTGLEYGRGGGRCACRTASVPSDIALYKSQYRLALNLKVKVQKDRTYTFTKFVAASREGWGGDAQADAGARDRGAQRWFRRASRAASRRLARTMAIRYRHRRRCAGADGRALGSLLSARHLDRGHALADGRLRADAGLYRARLLGQRYLDLPGAAAAASASAPNRWRCSALTRCPPRRRARRRADSKARCIPGKPTRKTAANRYRYFAHVLSEREIHVNADIAIAQWQYWLATHDRDWLKHIRLAGDPQRGGFLGEPRIVERAAAAL